VLEARSEKAEDWDEKDKRSERDEQDRRSLEEMRLAGDNGVDEFRDVWISDHPDADTQQSDPCQLSIHRRTNTQQFIEWRDKRHGKNRVSDQETWNMQEHEELIRL